MAKAKKLPSGSWRCLVYDYTDPTGKRIYKSFTCEDPSPAGKRKAEFEAAAFADSKKSSRESVDNITFGDALDKYIASRESVLSPRTVMDYKRIRNNEAPELMRTGIYDVTQDLIQRIINDDAKKHSPKTVRNTHGLISAVLKSCRPEFALNTRLPKAQKPDLYIPSDEEIKRLISHIRDTDMELPVLLAAFGPMRRGEICALDTDNISGNIVHVCKNMVLKESGGRNYVIKAPKSYSSDRYIEYPDFVAKLWKGKLGRITELSPDNITDKFAVLLKAAGIHHFRFHDLRHYCASVQHAMGIPDAYIMQRGGWGSDAVLKNVYRHAMSDRQKEMNNKANDYFKDLCNPKRNRKCNTKCNTNIKKHR